MIAQRTSFETAPLRRHLDKVTNGTTAPQIEADDTTRRVTRIETISSGGIDLDKTGSVAGDENLAQFALKGGDLLFSHINSMSVIGNSALVTSEVLPLYVGMNLLRLRPSSAVVPTFLSWCLKSDFVRHQVRQFAKPAINQASISTANLKRIQAPLPDLATQRQIADFLDRETARIDLLIEKKQKLVALLGEKARSFNELFFSKAEAIGNQPLHRLYRVITGKTPSRSEPDNFSDEDGLPWATPANLGFRKPILETKECLTELGCEGQPTVEAGTVLLNGIGSIGKIGIAGTRLSFNQQIHAIIPKEAVISNQFLYFQLLARKEQIVLLANSTTLPILNGERLGRLELRIFDQESQEQHCSKMDTLLQHEEVATNKINASVDRLKEYRSALITAAVTGQIDLNTHVKSSATERAIEVAEEVSY